MQIYWGQVITAVVGSAIVTAITILRVADSNTIIIANNSKSIDELKAVTVPRAEYEANNQSIRDSLSDIKTSLDNIERKIDNRL